MLSFFSGKGGGGGNSRCRIRFFRTSCISRKNNTQRSSTATRAKMAWNGVLAEGVSEAANDCATLPHSQTEGGRGRNLVVSTRFYRNVPVTVQTRVNRLQGMKQQSISAPSHPEGSTYRKPAVRHIDWRSDRERLLRLHRNRVQL